MAWTSLQVWSDTCQTNFDAKMCKCVKLLHIGNQIKISFLTRMQNDWNLFTKEIPKCGYLITV